MIEKKIQIRDYLKQSKLIADGSLGTYFAKRYETEEAPELNNLSNPERIKQIHMEYLRAGARLIRTNTFATNTAFLGTDISKVLDNVRAAIVIAKDAVDTFAKGCDEPVFLAGDIGPIPANDAEKGNRSEEYIAIAETFLQNGIQNINFETFADFDEILPVIKRIRELSSDAFISVLFSVNQFGYSGKGLRAAHLLRNASQIPEIDAVGLNCGIGPGHMQQILEKIPISGDKYLMVLPNAGYPKRIRNHIEFSNNAEYFAGKMQDLSALSADILGGCCGTNPHFIETLVHCLDLKQTERKPVNCSDTDLQKTKKKRGFLYEDGELKSHKLIAVELAPPLDANDEKLLEAAYSLKESGVDVLTFPDSPSGRTRVDSVLMAEKVRKETGLQVMPHICCRDKNAIAMRSMFMGAEINDIYNFLIITGDPIPTMARQTVKAVFNFEAVGLMEIARDMNEEIFVNGDISYGGAVNQNRVNQDVEIARVKKKMAAGAEFFLSQPVFTAEDAERLRRIYNETHAKILCGIMPFVSRKNASFMKNEIAGIHVADEIIERYPEQASRQEGEQVGIAIAKEVMALTADFVAGYYFSFPFNRVHMLKEILSGDKS